MNKRQIEEIVAGLVEKIIAGTDLELVAVEFVRERDWFLRVLLDKPGGITLDDCSAISTQLNPLLDDGLEIDTQYFLEVSSPGLDRPLKSQRDFERSCGKKIDVGFYAPQDGKKMITGTLRDYDGSRLVIETVSAMQDISCEKISSVKIHVEF